MKKLLLCLVIALCSTVVFGQAVQIFHDGEAEPKVFANGAIEKISFQPKFLGSTEYQHVYETLDGEFRFDKVDSVKFNLPHFAMYQQNYLLPRDAASFRVYYSFSGDDGVPYRDSRQFFVPHYDGQTFPYTLDYVLEMWGGSYPFTATISQNKAVDPFFVQFEGKSACLPDTFLLSDDYTFAEDVSKLIFPTEFQNLIAFVVTGDTIQSYYNEHGNFVIDWKDVSPSIYGFRVGNEQFEGEMHGVKNYPKGIHTHEEHMQALRELYDSTDGSNWTYQENWWSEKPLFTWENLHSIWYSPIISETVHCLRFDERQYPGLHGTLPESFTTFLDDCTEINLEGCGLYGVIPYKIRHHKNWQKFGWKIIPQSAWSSPGFDYTDINLHIDDVEIEDFVNETKTTTYDVLKKNKLTWVFNAGAVDMVDGISDERVNLYLDYCNKGFGIVAEVREFWDTPYTNYKNWVVGQQQQNNLPKDILWVNDFDKGTGSNYGSMSVLDSEGNLVWYSNFDRDIPESFWVQKVDSVCRKYLGEPEAHDPYVSTHYESSDYSMDGEVVTLQKATVGKGIDLVFMGDQYVDTMMVAGGMYEQDMTASMEYFFNIEPYKTLRDRFNVYYVKVVSKNGYDGPESHRLGYDNDLVFDYARKIPGVDMDNVTISVIWGNPNFSMFASGETATFDSGASIAYIGEGGPSSIICHEAGGHGFAKLLDEYIYPGYEDNHTQPGAEESFKEWIKTEYHDRGWGMNISATDDPELVPWAHFLKDERYKDEVGIYQGAWYWPEELWRSTDNSVMKEAGYLWFNAPSREAIYKRVMQLSEGDSWTYDYETFVAFDQEVMANARAAAKARGAAPKDNKIFIERAPQIVSDKFISIPQSKRKTPAKQSSRLNIPKDKTLTPVDQYKGDISKTRTIYVEGVKYVIE